MKEKIFKDFNIDSATEVRIINHCDMMKFDGCNCKIKKNDEGFYVGSAPVAKVGIMSYMMNDGSVFRELIPGEVLFDKDSMVTLKLKPITDSHPLEKVVNVNNASYRQVGYIGETVEREDNFLCCNMVITDANCIKKIDEGKQELSPGYTTEVVMQPGTFENEHYDGIQVSRKYNHLAVVDRARGGADIKMNLDGFELNINKEIEMPKVKIDGIEYEAAQEVINLITKKDEEISTEKIAVKTATDSLQTVTAERDTLKVKVDELEKRDIQKEVNDAVQSRLELERIATVVLDKVDENLDNRSLKIAIIAKKLPVISEKIDDSTSIVYIDTVLDAVKAGFTKEENDSISSQRKIVAKTDSKKDEVKNDENEARIRMINNQLNAYKSK
jgi:uncharacterized protein